MSSIEQVRISAGDIDVVVLPRVGARLHSLRVADSELMRRPNDLHEHERDPFFWGGYHMAPWCNRIAATPTKVAGETVAVQPNFEDGSAIHGQVYATAWERVGNASFRVDAGGAGWPWRYTVEIDYAVHGATLTIVQRLTNMSETDMPGGIGFHPWLVGRPRLTIASDRALPSNKAAADAEEVPVAGELDMRHPGQLREGVDATWLDPAEPPVELWWPENDLHATLRASSPTLHIVAAYAPERDAIAIEPQTHAPQGLQRLIDGAPGGMRLLRPRETLELPISLDFDIVS